MNAVCATLNCGGVHVGLLRLRKSKDYLSFIISCMSVVRCTIGTFRSYCIEMECIAVLKKRDEMVYVV